MDQNSRNNRHALIRCRSVRLICQKHMGSWHRNWPYLVTSPGRTVLRGVAMGHEMVRFNNGAARGGIERCGSSRISDGVHLGGWLANGFSGAYIYRPWFRFDSILAGCVVALWLGGRASEESWLRYLSSPVIPLLCWPALLLWTIRGDSSSHVWYLTAQTILCSIILLNVIVSDGSVVQSVLCLPWLRWVGHISYSWYIWQQLFTQYSDSKWAGRGGALVSIGASMALAVASFYLVERPFLRLKDRLREHQLNRTKGVQSWSPEGTGSTA